MSTLCSGELKKIIITKSLFPEDDIYKLISLSAVRYIQIYRIHVLRKTLGIKIYIVCGNITKTDNAIYIEISGKENNSD